VPRTDGSAAGSEQMPHYFFFIKNRREYHEIIFIQDIKISLRNYMARKKQNESFRDKCSSMFSPHFEILYKLMTALSSRYGITLPAEFWIATTLTIYSVYMHFYGYSDTELLFFASLTIISLLFANSGLIFNFIKKIRETVPETTSFLTDIENKEINEVQKF
jgi:hypothetical protein